MSFKILVHRFQHQQLLIPSILCLPNQQMYQLQHQHHHQTKKSKITKTATGISLFILLFSFGLFLNFNSISPMQQQQQQMNPNWRVGRVILSHEKWYHQYIPVYFHSFVDFTVDLFMNPMQLPQNIEQTTTIEKNNFPNNNGDVNSRSDL